MTQYILQAEGIYKHFPGVQALTNVNLELRRGEIRAMVGKNGAGKSTLIKIITGIHSHDAGTLTVDGREIPRVTARTMHDHGIRAIYQTNDLVPYFTVAEAITLHHEHHRLGGLFLDKRRCKEVAREILHRQLAVDIDIDALVRDLNVSQQQLVQIAGNLVTVPKIMIFDEPTSALSAHEIERLFCTIRSLKERGVSIIYISHRFEEVFDIADSITVLRDGVKIADVESAETSPSEIIRMMVGDDARSTPARRHRVPHRGDPPIVRVRELRSDYFQDVSFDLHEGEILGVFGGEGSGHDHVAQALFGRVACIGGSVEIDGESVRVGSPGEAIRRRIGYVPRNRKEEGLVIDFDIRENISLPTLDAFAKWSWIDTAKEDRAAETEITNLSIATPGTRTAAATLSGGNQQKVVIGRWIEARPRILLLDYPTSGIDVRAKAEVYAILTRLVEEGLAIILVSPEYEEISTLCDRVLVMRRGRVVKELAAAGINEHDMLRYAIGSSPEGVGA